MTHIGLLSDTHAFIHPKIYDFFESCDEIWHAGDIGCIEAADELSAFKPLKAVYGNIDGFDVRNVYPEHQRFFCEGVDVWITHIGGYPGHYAEQVRNQIKICPPKLFISGHSHILKVINDKKYNLLHINPGAAGKYGFHQVITFVKFTIDGTNIADLKICELKKS